MKEIIYLDNFATTPVAPEVRDEMLPWLERDFGNASSSTHELGWNAAEAVEVARDRIARLIGARRSSEVVFTGGATEANNTAIKGVYELNAGSEVHIVASAIEHPSVLAPCEVVAARGASVTLVAPDGDGRVDPDAVAAAVGPHTRLVSVMFANNEVGTIEPIAEIAAIARSRGALVHVDAAQAVGKINIDVRELDIDILSVSAHKLNGPKGVGAIWVRAGALPRGLPPLLHGGGQELGRRAGTLAVHQIVGFGAAARLARASLAEDALHADALAGMLLAHLRAELDGVHLNGPASDRLPGCLNVSIDGVRADALIACAPGLALSTGSACSSGHGGGSHVLRALGLSEERRRGAVRIAIGRYTTHDEASTAASTIVDAARQLRAVPMAA